MRKLVRFGVSMDQNLLDDFDRLMFARKYTSRSEALRDLIRDLLIAEEWKTDQETVGTVTIVYNHHVRDLTDKLTEIQHDHHNLILSAMHVHLDHDHCLEVLVVRGKGSAIKKIADTLIALKGVKHGKLAMTTTAKAIA